MSRKIFLILILLLFLFIEVLFGFQVAWGEKILPNIKVGGIQLGGQTQTQARGILQKRTEDLKNNSLTIKVGSQAFEVPVNNLGLEFEIENTIQRAYSVGHSKNLFTATTQMLDLVKRPVNLEIDFILNEENLNGQIETLAKNFETPVVQSKLEVKNGQVNFTPGKEGQKIDTEFIKKQLFENLSQLKLEPITAEVSTVKPEIPQELEAEAVKAATNFIGRKIKLSTNDFGYQLSENQILSLVSPNNSGKNFDLVANENKIREFVQNELNVKISQDPVNAKFQFVGDKVAVFQPSVDGVKLDVDKTVKLITHTIDNSQKETAVTLPVAITQAKVKTADVNNLGIKELIGRGVSNFAGSAAERIHNIKLATSKINGTLIPPGEVFSFNNTVGEISTQTGYTSAYIISKGRTVLGEGGGVCQVSTTAFRAAVYSGLEIVKRWAHSYRVGYYEQGGYQVGLDATIYVPTVDLKFRNDTANYILIQAYTKGFELYFDFYGTNDGRQVNVSKPVITNVKPPPEPQYIEDQTLPAGTVKQIDFSAVGASVRVNRTVTQNGQTLHSDTFASYYRPWQAIYKVGTGT